MNRRLTFVLVLILAILLPMTLAGEQKKNTRKKAAPTSVTGCLNKGTDANHFVLTNDKGKQYTVTGDSATLTKHATNHSVTITGAMAKENGKEVFKMGSATDLKMNSMCK